MIEGSHCITAVLAHNAQVVWKKHLVGLMLAILVAASGCDQRKSVLSELQIQKIKKSNPGITGECLEKMRYGGVEAMSDAIDQCFAMSSQRKWNGLWARGFELSRFCPFPASSCSYDTPGDQIWLTQRATFPISKDVPGKLFSIRLFHVEFIGRQTRERGNYGHLGQSSNEIVVDRVVSVSEIENPIAAR